MIQSKATGLISSFSEQEFRQFGLFCSSPFFNKEKVQEKFYEILKKYYPEFDNKSFEKEKVYSKLYPGKKYNDGVMRNILSRSLELAETFLAVNSLMKNEFEYHFLLMDDLANKNQFKLSERAASKAEESLKNDETKNEDHFYREYRLEGLRRKAMMKQKSSLYTPDSSPKKMADNLTISYLISMFKANTLIANNNLNVLKLSYEPYLMGQLEDYVTLESSKFSGLVYMKFYFNAYMLAKTEEPVYFHKLKEILETGYDELGDAGKSEIFSILANYCYVRINKGDIKFRTEHFKLIKEKIERGNYKGSKEFLSHIHYMDLVITGLESGNFEYVDEFIERYRDELDKSNRENTYNFARALIYFHKKEYGNAVKWASKVSTEDLSYKHQLKSLYLKIYFEMNETEPFYSHIDSYRHFLGNEKNIPQSTRESILAYVSYAKKLFDAKNKTEEKDFHLYKMRKEIEENRSMVNKFWLLEKISDIEKEK